jgi:hypothetical protein
VSGLESRRGHAVRPLFSLRRGHRQTYGNADGRLKRFPAAVAQALALTTLAVQEQFHAAVEAEPANVGEVAALVLA